MSRAPISPSLRYRRVYPSPPRVHWLLLFLAVAIPEALVLRFTHQPARDLLINLIFAIWPIYLSIWLRKIDQSSAALYWCFASVATGFLFSWLLWIVVVFEIREDLLFHYNRREPIGLKLHLIPTILFSFLYFQYHLRRIARQKALSVTAPLAVPEPELPS
ncbi:MAG TPA: hypothetical protein VN151_11895 [Terracidiphilus sp.]|nr:hypothetical protein [Terracidiphilus sp.]